MTYLDRVSLLGDVKDRTMIKGHKYAIYAEDAKNEPRFVGLADTIEEARNIKFDAESAGFIGVAIMDGSLNKVE
jgi:hypothetical protein